MAECSTSITSATYTTTVQTNNKQTTPRNVKLSSQLEYTRRMLSKARASLWRMKKNASARNLPSVDSSCTGICGRLNSLPKTQRLFFETQIKSATVSKKGMRWSEHDKLLSLGLFYKSPAAFRFLARIFNLPGMRTLQRFISAFDVCTGFNCDYLHALQKRAESLNSKERCVVVTFDGMSLRSALKYLEYKDRIMGFVDFGAFQSSEPSRGQVAKHALQFMVRGISTRWKQPIGHIFIGNSISPDVLKQMITTLIAILENIHLVVKAVICDQEASHRSCLNSLGVTTTDPFFVADSGNKVYVMHDVPHLFKNVRNNLLTYNFVVDAEEISFDHIAKLYELDSKSTLRLAPKLIKDHIDIKMFKKMSVRLATQVLSESVGVAIAAYVHFKQMDAVALPTSSFVKKMNTLFDILNSQSPSEKHKWKKPLTKQSREKMEFLDETTEWISSWKFKNKKTGKMKETLPFKEGLQMSLRAIRSLCCDLLHNDKFNFVLTSRFNQDIVENWFSCIRGKGHNNDSRTTLEYESASKNIAVNWLLEKPERGTNCTLDFDSFIGMLNKEGQSTSKEEVTASAAAVVEHSAKNDGKSQHHDEIDKPAEESQELDDTFDDIPLTTDWHGMFSLSDVDANIVYYLSGYISQKINKRYNCPKCSVAYERSRNKASEQQKTSAEKYALFVQLKTFAWAKHGLTIPSLSMFKLCESIERIVQMNIETLSTGKNVMSYVRECIYQGVDADSYELDSVCEDHMCGTVGYIIRLYLRVRIHHFVRIRNRELKQYAAPKPKRNRKAKKIVHS